MNHDWLINIKVVCRVIPVLFFAPPEELTVLHCNLLKSPLKVNHIPARFKLVKLPRFAVIACPEP